MDSLRCAGLPPNLNFTDFMCTVFIHMTKNSPLQLLTHSAS